MNEHTGLFGALNSVKLRPWLVFVFGIVITGVLFGVLSVPVLGDVLRNSVTTKTFCLRLGGYLVSVGGVACCAVYVFKMSAARFYPESVVLGIFCGLMSGILLFVTSGAILTLAVVILKWVAIPKFMTFDRAVGSVSLGVIVSTAAVLLTTFKRRRQSGAGLSNC